VGLEKRKSNMAATDLEAKKALEKAALNVVHTLPLWQLDIEELTGHNLEARGREEVNHLLQSGWLLLHIYTLKYHEDGVWRERPMAILGRPRTNAHDDIL
jgi:FtsZ-binding cell division protein ZapB